MSDNRTGTESLFDAMYTQRAIRKFRDEPVPKDLLWRVIEAATKAPSGTNSQPWKFIVIEDEGRRRAIAQMVRDQSQKNPGTREYFSRGSRSEERSERLMLTGALSLLDNLAQAPVLIIPCLDRDGAPIADSFRSGSSIYGAVQNLQLAARGLGLGTVLAGFEAAIEAELRAYLGIPDTAVPVALVPLGFPDANFGPTRRKPVDEVTFWDGWGATENRA